MKRHSMYIENYNTFLGYNPKIEENAQGLTAKACAHDIELRGVNFGYSQYGGTALVLKDINMHIKAGEKIAIVGDNGAGKSTLIKLILRLYLPDDGAIYMDGEDTSAYNLHSYRRCFGTIFQDFQLYAFSIGENVIMDNLSDSEEERERIWNALESLGLAEKVRGHAKGLGAAVTKEFEEDGAIFSGGEAQKLAIARILARDCGVVIMDEPSSNLDPMSEHELYKNMIEAAKDKTMIIISHRLSAAVDADRIYLLDNGEIIERGTHQQLMRQNGKYAEMFIVQASKYLDVC
jgi:ATP-binding cassette subfamily B protein